MNPDASLNNATLAAGEIDPNTPMEVDFG